MTHQWIDFTDNGNWNPRGGPGIRLSNTAIYVDIRLQRALGKPRQVYFSYCLAPLAIAIHPILTPADIPDKSVPIYQMGAAGVAATKLLKRLGLHLKQPLRLPARIEDGMLIIDLEDIRAETE